MKIDREDIQLLVPDVERDAPFALDWFKGDDGKQTLLSMGNAEHEIVESTLDGERATIQEFIEFERDNKQITRMIIVGGVTIGAVWIELFENHGVKSPSIHIILGNPEYRGKGVGTLVMKAAMKYAIEILGAVTIYSRYLSSNESIAAVNKKLGFKADGREYTDENGLLWQNVKLNVEGSKPLS